jgi:hypothetical protein
MKIGFGPMNDMAWGRMEKIGATNLTASSREVVWSLTKSFMGYYWGSSCGAAGLAAFCS